MCTRTTRGCSHEGLLIVFGGLPATGKTSIARELARQIGAVYLRIDSIEQAIRDSAGAAGPLEDAGYRAACAVAEDNLRLGRTVVADSVNPLPLTRDAWLAVARRAGAAAVEIEIVCSDAAEHRRRVEERTTDVAGLKLPTWQEVMARDYRPWDREHIVMDTAVFNVPECVRTIRRAIQLRIGPEWPFGSDVRP